eukprot:jgi/Mesvir1/8856/Mv02752-RA.1
MADPISFLHKRDTEVKLPRPTRVKNKTPAPTQITAEQILREARERIDDEVRPPRQKITDADELAEYQLRKRTEFENLVRRSRWNLRLWTKYATWEESQRDFVRARSVWERALEVDYRNVTLWLKYAEMEMKHRNVNHARNIWDRAVTLLPRCDQFWYKYIHMEEMLGNVPGARQVFERWMAWEPDHAGWMAYIRMELRYNEVSRARALFERYVQCHPSVKAWIKYAKFETKLGEVEAARACYERSVRELGEDGHTEELFVHFCEFEEKCREVERARVIYKYALDHLPKGSAEELYKRFVAFEKQHGDREGIEDVVISKRRFQYEEEIKKNSSNYDVWFDYVRLEENHGTKDKVREVYERAIANVPPASEKWFWQRYIYLWINYALFEELDAQDVERAREVYTECLKLIPHASFSFSKIWLLAAKFELRQKNLAGARKILGNAIGMAPKDKIFKSYIEIELQLGNIDRCRKLYEKYLEWAPSNCYAWSKFLELERSLGESDRGRAIFELAISQPVLDMPEVLWKAYIDFEIANKDAARTRDLYERLLDRTKHIKVWLSYAQFEATAPLPWELEQEEDEEEGGEPRARPLPSAEEQRAAKDARAERARGVYGRAFRSLRETAPDAKEERVMLLEAWREFEARDGSESSLAAVTRKMPKRVKRKRPVTAEDGTPAGFEEYYDYIFPDDEGGTPSLKILEAAYRWKKQKLGLPEDDGAQQEPEEQEQEPLRQQPGQWLGGAQDDSD